MNIIDDGHGISIEDIKNKFMMVATSSRTRNKKSPKGRNIVKRTRNKKIAKGQKYSW